MNKYVITRNRGREGDQGFLSQGRERGGREGGQVSIGVC